MVQEGMVVRVEARDYGNNNDSRGDEYNSLVGGSVPSPSPSHFQADDRTLKSLS